MSDSPVVPEGVDLSAPHSARVWNYWLGGKDNYPVDRELGDQILGIHPKIAVDARAGRAFLVRTITHLAVEEGVRQFLDVGTGLPTHQNTHEIAQAAAPDSKVVYVDNDPMVLAHARALLTGTEEGATEFVDHDLRDTERVLARAGELLDFSRPVGLSIIGTLGHIPTLEEAVDLVRSYLAGLPSGSFLVVADAVLPDEGSAAEALDEWNKEAALAYRGHTLAEFTSYFDGLELLEPGVGPSPLWRPAPVDVGRTPDTDMYGAVARKP
ncbi:SAM-dependent methyltransferase [Nocardiopsis ganjiahuensis]|uniref:SAM-dependent methyltransferase n=1 Tax=Nocardiopsis ganjiahuensis TaxID=239984 RepID=UPI00034C9EBD|nr:SAM-dependent methyltransferase [Nocardiopsis ganjiahuensis]